MTIVSNIQSLCKEHNMAIPKLESDLDFGRGSIYKWDKNSPSIDKLQKVAAYFNVTTDVLIFGYDKEIRQVIRELTNNDNGNEYFPNLVHSILDVELQFLKKENKEFEKLPFALNPESILAALRHGSLSNGFKKDLLTALHITKVRVQDFPLQEAIASQQLNQLDTDIQAITEAARKMTPEQRKKTLKLLRLTFDEFFSEEE